MKKSIVNVIQIWNDTGSRYEIAEDTDGVHTELRFIDKYGQTGQSFQIPNDLLENVITALQNRLPKQVNEELRQAMNSYIDNDIKKKD